jgi:predicted transcriptional regulator
MVKSLHRGPNLPNQESLQLEPETRADLVESDISITLSDNLDESFVSHEIGPLAETIDEPMDAVKTEASTSMDVQDEKCQVAVKDEDLGRCDSPAPVAQNKPDVEDDAVIVTANLNEKCLFVCGICHQAFTCLRNHVTADHQLSPEEYQALYPNIQYERKTYHR